VSCATDEGALQISAFGRNPSVRAAAADIKTGTPSTSAVLVGVDTRHKHYVLSSMCSASTGRVALTHRGLTSVVVVPAGDRRPPSVYCSATRNVLVNFRFRFDASGKPVRATIVIRTEPKTSMKSKPIAYVQWTPQRSVTYYTRACKRRA